MNLQQTVKILVASNLVTIGAIGFLAVSGFTAQKAKFTEIDAERINIVGENGKPVMVLANKSQIPGPSMNGKAYSREIADGRQYMNGIIFFNDEGDEVGGLIYNGSSKLGNGHSAVGHLSLDQFKQNQVIAMQYIDNGKSHRAGLTIWDRPTQVTFDKQLDLLEEMRTASPERKEAIRKELADADARGEGGTQRIFVGSRDQSAEIQLKDTKGKIRIRLVVDAKDVARLEFLDGDGKVVSTIPARG